MKIDEVYKRRFKDEQLRIDLWDVLVKSFFQKYIDPKDTVLDVPCGYAEFINTITCKKKLAIDINDKSAQKVNKDVTFYQASSTKLPLKPNSVDKIFVSNFFEHISHEDIANTIAEFMRVLKPGGRVLVLQPNIRFAFRNYWMFFDHTTPIDDRALDEIFSIKGFTPVMKILKFMPFTSSGRLPVNKTMVRIYLKIRPLWYIFGRQTFVIYEK